MSDDDPTPAQSDPPLPPAPAGGSDESFDRVMRRRTRRSFVGFAVAAAAGVSGWRWLRSRREDGGIPWPLRRALDVDENLARDFFSSTHTAPTHAYGSAPQSPRVNGNIGLTRALDADAWRLRVSGLAARDGAAELTLADIKALPRVDLTMRLCCIEGWSVLVNWSGARFADFVNRYPPVTRSGAPADPKHPADLFDYVAMSMPDGAYYVGLDAASALHPQTLLCYEIDGKPLSVEHGAPLRLVIPSKYGVKNIKRIGQICYTGVRPADYWAQRGYDWYCGL